MSAKSDKWVSILLELDEMGVQTEELKRACRIKDSDTIAGWYRGTTPRPKNRALLTRFLGKMKALEGQYEPTDEQVHESLLNPYDGCEWERIPNYVHLNIGDLLWQWDSITNWRESREAFRERYQRNASSGLPHQEWEQPNHPRNTAKICQDKDLRISVVSRFHPDEFVRIHFQNL